MRNQPSYTVFTKATFVRYFVLCCLFCSINTVHAKTLSLSVSSTEVTIDVMTGNTASVNVTSNTTWTSVSNQSWLTVNSGGTGNATLIFTATDTNVATRSAIITISSPGVSDINVTVTQNWGVNTDIYQLNMTVTGVISFNNVEYQGSDLQVAAFLGNECRGTTVLKYVAAYHRYMAFLMIWGNAQDVNKVITYKCFSQTDSSLFVAENQSLKFIPEVISGSSANPYLINVQQESVNIAGVIPVNVSSLTGLTTGSTITINDGALLNINKTLSLKNITVNPGGKITLQNGFGLTTQTLLLQSDPNGMLETATFVDSNLVSTPSVSATVQQYLTSGRNWYISSPVTTTTSQVFAASTSKPLYWYDEAHGSTAPWVQITNTSTSLMPMKGYIANLATSDFVSFNGILNTGTQSITVYRTAGQTKEGFNLVGNPYPSYLDWGLATKTNLTSTVWYRTKNANTYVFDTFNSSGGIGTNNNGKGAVTKYIPPMQAFWVRVDEGKTSGTLTVDNSMRSHSKGSNPLKIRSQVIAEEPVFRMQVSNGVNSDEAVIYFNANASDVYDTYDSPKMSNASSIIPEIYTLAGNVQVSINGLNSIKLNEEIPLGFNTEKSGNFSLQASELSNFDSNTKILLKDNMLNTLQELTIGSVYNFSSEVTNTTNRFSIIFKSSGITTDKSQNKIQPAITVFVNLNGKIVINTVGINTEKAEINIYNSSGKIIKSDKLKGSITTIDDLFPSGIYVIEVKSDDSKSYQKIQL